MAEKIARNNVNGVIKISDGTTPTPNEIELVFDNGNLSITFGGEETHIRYDRHEISGAAKGKEMPSDISFECDFVEAYKESGDADPTVFEAIHGIGAASTWASRIPGNKYGVKVTLEISNPDDSGASETIVLDKCYIEQGGSSISENEDVDKISFKLKSLDNMPTVTRTPAA